MDSSDDFMNEWGKNNHPTTRLMPLSKTIRQVLSKAKDLKTCFTATFPTGRIRSSPLLMDGWMCWGFRRIDTSNDGNKKVNSGRIQWTCNGMNGAEDCLYFDFKFYFVFWMLHDLSATFFVSFSRFFSAEHFQHFSIFSWQKNDFLMPYFCSFIFLNHLSFRFYGVL